MDNSHVRYLAKASLKWKTVQLPEELLNKVDEIVEIEELGYASRGEFIREAVRLRVEDIEKRRQNKGETKF
jgi:metal-responsive CopG/Arc/MetJ family transcriptional regulator